MATEGHPSIHSSPRLFQTRITFEVGKEHEPQKTNEQPTQFPALLAPGVQDQPRFDNEHNEAGSLSTDRLTAARLLMSIRRLQSQSRVEVFDKYS